MSLLLSSAPPFLSSAPPFLSSSLYSSPTLPPSPLHVSPPRVQAPFPGSRIALRHGAALSPVRASPDDAPPIDAVEENATAPKAEGGGEEKVLPPLQSKLEERMAQKLKMKLARKIRLRRRRLVRKRRLRKKGRWPPSKMKKNKNV